MLRRRAHALFPGVLASGTIALAATWLAQHYASPVMLFALLLGMAFHFLHEEGRCVVGIDFSSKTILRIGVALLGARITIGQIAALGAWPVATVVVGVVSTIAFGMVAARLLGLRPMYGLLSGGAVAICGASAALAISSSMPEHEDKERDTILTVVVVTTLSTVAMIVYPLIAHAAGFDDGHAGIFLGGTIHDVAQVVGAGYTISPTAGDVATYVKLLRVALLLPVVFAIPLLFARKMPQARGKAPLPLFLLGFAALVCLRSAGAIPAPAVEVVNDVSRWCLVAAIAALGMKTSFRKVFAVGWRPIGLMVAETAWIAALVFVAVRWCI
ncbi:MAG: putative sulfate exporter family transporter [Hyphomicrobiales bacterium]|nr:putative sulfate exporter family transporter [Hyphomicrobiales bacterium]